MIIIVMNRRSLPTRAPRREVRKLCVAHDYWDSKQQNAVARKGNGIASRETGVSFWR